MLLLTATTDKVQVITGQAVTVDVHASFYDQTTADPPVMKGSTSGRLNTAISTATTTDVVAAPASSTIRNVKTLHIRNKHASSSVDVTVQFNQNGTLYELFKTTLVAQSHVEYVEGVGFFVVAPTATTVLMKVLSADDTGGSNSTSAQPWFPTAGGVTVAADTTYWMDGLIAISRAAGTTTHTIGLLFAGTATLTSIQYMAETNVGETEALLPESRVTSRVATVTTITAASTTATEQKQIKLDGIVRVNATGTLIPQFQYITNAPGGAPTIKANSYFRLTPLGNGSFTAQGTWA